MYPKSSYEEKVASKFIKSK